MFILGGQEGLALAEKHGASAVVVTGDNQVLVSPRLEKKLQRLKISLIDHLTERFRDEALLPAVD